MRPTLSCQLKSEESVAPSSRLNSVYVSTPARLCYKQQPSEPHRNPLPAGGRGDTMHAKVFQKKQIKQSTPQPGLKPPRPFAQPNPPAQQSSAPTFDGVERAARHGHNFGRVAVRGGVDSAAREQRNETGLPERLKAGIERLSGLSMDNVRVRYNSPAPARHRALAHTQGTEIHLGAGQEKHLAHEAWHVVQQKQGRVQPTMQMKRGVAVNEDAGLEHEADVMGAKAEGTIQAAGHGIRLSPKITGSANHASAPAMQFQRNRRRWSPAQREQSRKFWEKKQLKEARKRDSQLERLRVGRVRERATDITNTANLHTVSAPAGNTNPMGARNQPAVEPREGAQLGYKDVMSNVAGFLHPDHPVRSLHNAGGPQFIQQFDDIPGQVTRRVGIDVEPSGHVQALSPHINLQTQHNGIIQQGPLADPHTPVRSAEPFENSRGAGFAKPLHGLQLTPEERRKFMERYLKSSGIGVNRV
jgi:hypothetical protein